MRSEKNIFAAFVLNLAFSLFEFIGGVFTGSVAIISDAIHDLGDAASIGVSYFMEKKSTKQPDDVYTYGYARYSVLGGAVTMLTLLAGTAIVIYNAVLRIITPTPIDYNGMILFAVVGVCVNLGAALITRKGESLNQKAVNLHMLEDVLGWIVVLVGAVVMRFTDLALLDPILSIGVAIFIGVNAVRNLKEAVDIFLEKTPHGTDMQLLKNSLSELSEVQDVHHIHLWTMDGRSHYATMHIVTDGDPHRVKDAVRERLKALGIDHVTLEVEAENEHCHARHYHVEHTHHCGHHHHHHH